MGIVNVAARLGLEPRYSPPEGDVLPLDDPAIFSVHHYPKAKSKILIGQGRSRNDII